MSVPEEEHLIQPCSSGQQKTKPDTIEFTSGNSKQELTVTKELGRGAFGEVVLATDNRGRPFAVKKVKCTNIQAYQAIAQELEMLLGLSHHNIMKLHAIDFIDFTAIFVMEYCANGTLNKKLDEKILMNTKFKWIQQLASALSYLHKNNIVHRDLKPDNVLLNKDDEIKLADFGIARNFTCMTRGREEYANDPGAYLSEYLDTDMGTFAGTPYWVAPEVFDHSYDEKADIFSLGVIFYAILSHQVFEFEGQKYYGAFVEHYGGKLVGVGLAMSEKGEQLYPEFCEDHNKALVVIIKSMLDYDPVNRKSLDTILVEVNDAFFEHLSSENSTRKNIMASVEDMADAMQHLGYWIACQLFCQRFVESCERCCTRCGRKCSCRRADCEEKAGDDIELQPCCATKF